MTSTLTDVLRGLSDEALATLFRMRPDLVVPPPSDLSALAARAQSRPSIARVVDALDRFHLEILDALRLTRDPEGLTSMDEVLAIAASPAGGADAAAVRAAVERLHALLLTYGPPDALRLASALDEVLGPYPAGLGRPAAELDPDAADLVGDPARLRRTVLSAPSTARAVLDRLAAGPPVGATTGGATAGGAPTESGPVTWLIEHGLLVPVSPTSVELPREVGLLLRRDTGPLGTLHPVPPKPAAEPVDLAAVDAAGAGQTMEAVRQTEALLEAYAAEEPPVLRTGGVGSRDLRRLARAAGLEERTAAVLTEVAYAAGLLGGGESDGADNFRPTTGYDAWRTAPLAGRWYALATSWLAMPRRPGLVAQRDERDRLIGALSPEVERSGTPAIRRAVLGILRGLPAGSAPTPEETLALLGWHAPRRASTWAAPAGEVLAEAALLGVTGRGALTSYGRDLLEELAAPRETARDPLGVHHPDTPAGLPEPAARLDTLLPAPVDKVLVQADLTVVVPGPPEPTLAAELELVADHESAGGGSVYRVTRDSIRRALDAGYGAEDLHGLFARRSRTAIPQSLRYLIDDLARSHGGLRVGTAGAYLRSEDEALVTQVLTDRRLAPLGLRRLAPTVLVGAVGTGRLLTALREAGYTPVPEDASGAALLVKPRARRAPARPPVSAPLDPFAVPRTTTARLLGIIEDIRRRDAAAQATARIPAAASDTAAGAAQAHTEAMAVLQQAVRDRARVWVRYVDAHGTAKSRLLRPVSIGAGYLRAEDERTDTLHTFALHRVTAATLD